MQSCIIQHPIFSAQRFPVFHFLFSCISQTSRHPVGKLTKVIRFSGHADVSQRCRSMRRMNDEFTLDSDRESIAELLTFKKTERIDFIQQNNIFFFPTLDRESFLMSLQNITTRGSPEENRKANHSEWNAEP